MTELERRIQGYRLTMAEILYHLPDHPSLLQSFTWQTFNIEPEFPVLTRFLVFGSGQSTASSIRCESAPRG